MNLKISHRKCHDDDNDNDDDNVDDDDDDDNDDDLHEREKELRDRLIRDTFIIYPFLVNKEVQNHSSYQVVHKSVGLASIFKVFALKFSD